MPARCFGKITEAFLNLSFFPLFLSLPFINSFITELKEKARDWVFRAGVCVITVLALESLFHRLTGLHLLENFGGAVKSSTCNSGQLGAVTDALPVQAGGLWGRRAILFYEPWKSGHSYLASWTSHSPPPWPLPAYRPSPFTLGQICELWDLGQIPVKIVIRAQVPSDLK